MDVRIFLSFVLAVCLISSTAYAQKRIYNFLHFTEKEGLSSNEVEGLAQDSNGLIWISGKRGLSYFDGQKFTEVKFEHTNGVMLNYLGSMAIDHHNRIWITSNSHGLICYDRNKPAGENLSSYTAKVSNKGLVKTNLYDVLASKSGLIYFSGQETDLQSLNPETGEIKQISMPGIPSKNYLTIFSLDEDSLGNIWMGTRYDGLICYNPKKHTAKQINLENEGENAVDGIVLRPDRIYAGYYDHDLIAADYNFQNSISSILGWDKSVNFYDNSISSIAFWPTENKILIGHVSNGIYTYQPETNQVEYISLQTLMPITPKPTRIFDFCIVKDGYWLATNSGLFYYSTKLNQINSLIEDRYADPIIELFNWKGKVWYRTETDFGELDANQDFRLSKYSLKQLKIGSLLTTNEAIYISTIDQGVYEFKDPKKGMVPLEVSNEDQGLRKADCNSIVLDTIAKQAVLWIGSWNSGLYRYNLKTRQLDLFTVNDGLPDSKVICVGKDAEGSIWLGMDGYGLVRLENKIKPEFIQFSQNKQQSKTIQSNTVFSFLLDRQSRFWFSNASSGIAEIKKNNKGEYEFIQYPEKNTQPWLYSVKLQEDKNGLIWMKSQDGTMLFHPDAKVFFHLNESAGIYPPEEYITHSFFIQGNTLFWCTNWGLVKGDLPVFFPNNEISFKPLINQFIVQHLDRSEELFQNEIKLSPDENNLIFNFSAAEQVFWQGLKFQYQLIGFDTDWVESSVDQLAVYNNLEGDDYTFQVRVGDQFGNWSTQLATIDISLASHWYATLWFKLLFIVLFLSAITLFYFYRLQQHKNINRLQAEYNQKLQQELLMNESKIKEQAADIEKEKQERLENDFKQKLYESELKAIRSQMNPHFIFNVLNSIEAYVVEKDSKSASDLIQKFASISRLVLENSQYSIVSLSSEIQLLKLYLELEQERFNHAFDFELEIQKDLTLKERKIPSMLIQPIVENAVHHGVRHLKSKKGLIRISIAEHDKKIVIQIMDNGVGFNKDSDNKSSAFKQSSFGIKGVQERINIINSYYPMPIASMQINQEDEDSIFTTIVCITLPSSSDLMET